MRVSRMCQTMKTQTIDTKQIKQTINLIDLAGRYTELHRESPKEFSGVCPKKPECPSTDDSFHVKSDMFFCRKCYPLGNNKPHDAIAFLQWVEGKTFVDACNALTGDYRPIVTQARPAVKDAQQREWNEANQRQQAMRAHNALIAQKADEARAALTYLYSRGVNLDTAKAFKIGVRMTSLPGAWDSKTNLFTYPRQIAISLPWFDQSGALVAVKYRFLADHTYTDIDGRQRTNNKTSKGNFTGHVFGWQAIAGPGKVDTLVICEGELNALSIWQAGSGHVDVLSTGTESMIAHLPQPVIDLAKQYKRVIVWADRGTLADSAALAIDAASMRSPMIDGYPKGADANDLLKMGKLGALLDAMLQRLAPSTHAVPQTPTAEPPTEIVEDWERVRDERWISRWRSGLIEDTPVTRANIEAAAKRLGIGLNQQES